MSSSSYVSLDGTGVPPPATVSVKEESTIFRGREYKKVTTETKLGKIQRVGKFCTGLVAGIISVPTTVLSLGKLGNGIVLKDTIVKSFSEMASGTEEDVKYKTSDSASPSRKASYNPNSQAAIKKYAKDNWNSRLVAKGHQYIFNAADSSIILIPKDPDTGEYCEVKFWDLKTGEDIAESSRLERAIGAYLTAIDKIENYKDQAGHVVSFTHVILDFKHKSLRGYNNPSSDLSASDAFGLGTGTEIKLSDDEWKEMLSFFDQNKTDGKKSIHGKRVHDPDDDDASTRPPFSFHGSNNNNSSGRTPTQLTDQDREFGGNLRASSTTSVNNHSSASVSSVQEEEEEEEKLENKMDPAARRAAVEKRQKEQAATREEVKAKMANRESTVTLNRDGKTYPASHQGKVELPDDEE